MGVSGSPPLDLVAPNLNFAKEKECLVGIAFLHDPHVLPAPRRYPSFGEIWMHLGGMSSAPSQLFQTERLHYLT